MLTDLDCRNATCPPELKRKRLTDGGRLYLEVAPNGSKRWFWKFYENTLRTALRRMGYSNENMTPHGFRSMARTLIVERLPGVSPDVIEAQLAHGKSGPLGMAYDRAEFMDQRRQMMKAWADYLDGLRKGAVVIPMKVKS